MQDLSTAFFDEAQRCNALKFGEFTLKSGRVSPYFFNAGALCDGAALSALGSWYAQTLLDSQIDFDMLFGPAYKGIPLVTTTAVALAPQRNVPWCFNRKEAKQHGEGGTLVGAALQGRVVVVDDVITAGTAIRESVEIIQAHGAELAAVVVTLDRQERGQGRLSAVQEVEQSLGVPVLSVASLSDLLRYRQGAAEHEALYAYQQQYGIGS